MTAALKPCPHCDGEAELISEPARPCHYVRCMCCEQQFTKATPEAAIAAWNRRPALEAALSRRPAESREGVKVKRLEWQRINAMRWQAYSIVGAYVVRSNHTQRDDCWFVEGPGHTDGINYTIEAAKAAAQSDFTRRILSSLETEATQGEKAELVVSDEAREWQRLAGLEHPPTPVTLEYRRAIQGEGEYAYTWSDKPHRLVFNLCSIIEEAAALASQPSDREGWRTMESAPKDGQHILLSCDVDPPGGFVCEAYYEPEGDRWFQANTHWTDAHDGRVYPIAWMPLPSPTSPTMGQSA